MKRLWRFLFGAVLCWVIFCTQNTFAKSFSEIVIDDIFMPRYTNSAWPFDCEGMSYGDDYKIHICYWEEKIEDEWVSLTNDSDVLEYGGEYRMRLVLVPDNEGDYFENPIQIKINDDDVNEYRITVTDKNGHATAILAFWYTSPVEKDQIDDVKIDYVATGYETGHFEGVEEQAGSWGDTKYSFDMENWETYESSYHPELDEFAKGLGTVYMQNRSKNPAYAISSPVKTIEISRAEVPKVEVKDTTSENAKDGKIMSAEDIEYTQDISAGVDNEETKWQSIVNGEIFELGAGDYFVRVKASGSVFASDYIQLAIGIVKSIKEPQKEFILEEQDIKNPKTGDNIINVVVLEIVSIAGVILFGWAKRYENR